MEGAIQIGLRRASLLSALLGAVPGPLWAQAAPAASVIRVRDQMGTMVPHALVQIEGGTGRVTDDSGRVYLVLSGDSVRLSVRRIGHEPFVGWVPRTHAGEYEVTLRAFAQTLSAISIVERGARSPLELSGFYDRMLRAQRGAGSAEFITPEELDARPSIRASDVFYGRRSIKVSRVGTKAVLLGRGYCPISVFVDGQLARPERVNGSIAIDDLVVPGQIAAIELYASAAQAPGELIPLVGSTKYGSCGVVAIWTGGRH